MLRLITSRAQKASLQSQILARRRTATALPQRQSMLSYTSVVGRSFHSSATRSASSVTDEEFRKRVRESTELTSLFLKLIQKLEANPNLRLRDNKPGYFRGFQVFRILWLLLDTEVMRASYACKRERERSNFEKVNRC